MKENNYTKYILPARILRYVLSISFGFIGLWISSNLNIDNHVITSICVSVGTMFGYKSYLAFVDSTQWGVDFEILKINNWLALVESDKLKSQELSSENIVGNILNEGKDVSKEKLKFLEEKRRIVRKYNDQLKSITNQFTEE